MDGETALQYVRSRHAEGEEGSDFARGRRQQEVLLALKARLMSKDIYLNPGELEKLYGAFDEATDMDMNIGELVTVGKLFMGIPKEQTQRISLEDKLYTPQVRGTAGMCCSRRKVLKDTYVCEVFVEVTRLRVSLDYRVGYPVCSAGKTGIKTPIPTTRGGYRRLSHLLPIHSGLRPPVLSALGLRQEARGCGRTRRRRCR